METMTMQVVVDFRKKPVKKKEKLVEAMSLGELLYRVMFGDGRLEAVARS